jgi:hypothetical protein
MWVAFESGQTTWAEYASQSDAHPPYLRVPFVAEARWAQHRRGGDTSERAGLQARCSACMPARVLGKDKAETTGLGDQRSLSGVQKRISRARTEPWKRGGRMPLTLTAPDSSPTSGIHAHPPTIPITKRHARDSQQRPAGDETACIQRRSAGYPVEVCTHRCLRSPKLFHDACSMQSHGAG